MCGIAGILNFNGHTHADTGVIFSMLQAIRHRGPDGNGEYRDDFVTLGHARLSIIDLEGGAQPIHNEDRGVWVVFNGEIYNYLELRAQLEARGHRFYTRSDTEVLVHLYEDFGVRFVEGLVGQFAIAIWDAREKRLILARDHTGITPLYYTFGPNFLAFASEAKALMQVPGVTPGLNPVALDQLMTLWAPVTPASMFDGVYELQPGHTLEVDISGRRTERCYWDWRFPEDGDYLQGSENELAEQLRALLIDATCLRLRADVPVGAYLSGGLDSSITTAMIHRYGGVPLRTFSIGFDDESLDEGSYQQVMVRHLGAQHSHVKCTRADIAREFPSTIWHTETPLLRTAPAPMRLLSRLARDQGYKVVLTGEGADEALGGYDIFKEGKIRRFWARFPQSKSRPLLLKRLYPYLDLNQSTGRAYLQAFFGIGLNDPDQEFFTHLPRWDTTSKTKDFFSKSFKERLGDDAVAVLKNNMPPNLRRWHPFNRGQYVEAKTLLRGYLLSAQGDRMLMGSSVEGRFPFLDHRVIEFANRLPPKLKMKALNEKYLLKLATKDLLPQAIVDRRKQPYRAPDAAAFFGPEGTPRYVQDLLSEECIRDYGYFDPAKTTRLVEKIRRSPVLGYKDNMAFVVILSTQIWHAHFVKKNSLNT